MDSSPAKTPARPAAQIAGRLGFDRPGYFETPLPGVKFFWADEPVPRAPLLYDSGLVIILQGGKTIFVDDKVFAYDRDHYLVLGLPLALECETRASREEPLVGLFIDVDLPMLFELSAMTPARERASEESSVSGALGIEPVRLSDAMRDSAWRLLTCLRDPDETAALGPAMVREVLFRALQGDHSHVLRSMTRPDGRCATIARILRGVQADVATKRSVADMAREAGMSEAGFYRAFRTATGSSPLQYIKSLRLTRARSLIVHDNMQAKAAAAAVGYESSSQFSREFKAYFGVTAAQARESAYAFIKS